MRSILLSLWILLCACNSDDTRSTEQALAGASCMQDVWTAHGNTQALGCTANDVGIASASNIRGLNGLPLDSCIEGTYFSFIADFTVDLTAQARYDVGLYFATDGDPNGDGALTGTCDAGIISAANSPNFVQLDPSPDTCGDIDSSHNPQIVTVQVNDVLCKAGAGGLLSLPNCTSWRQAGSNEVCDEPSDAFPGSPSKCSCDRGFTVGIHVEPPNGTIVKSLVQHLCATERYGVSIANTSLTQTLQLTALVDSTYGDLLSVHDAVQATTCAPTAIPVGGTYACTFDALFCGPTESDTATVTLDDGAGTVLERTSNTLTVDVSAVAR